MTKEIQLTQDKTALVSDDKYEYLNQWRWYAHKDKNTWYAHRHPTGGVEILMHREIMGAPTGMKVDHRDGDGLNNTNENLRVCTHADNMRNRKMQKNNKTGFRGVRVSGKKFCAMISVDHKPLYLGTFLIAEQAARAYDAAAKRLFGEFARLHFPEVQS
jgi:hypothetical protein